MLRTETGRFPKTSLLSINYIFNQVGVKTQTGRDVMSANNIPILRYTRLVSKNSEVKQNGRINWRDGTITEIIQILKSSVKSRENSKSSSQGLLE